VCNLVYDVCTKVLDRTVNKRERERVYSESKVSLLRIPPRSPPRRRLRPRSPLRLMLMPRKRFRSIPRVEMIEPRFRLKDEQAVLAALTHTSNRWKVETNLDLHSAAKRC